MGTPGGAWRRRRRDLLRACCLGLALCLSASPDGLAGYRLYDMSVFLGGTPVPPAAPTVLPPAPPRAAIYAPDRPPSTTRARQAAPRQTAEAAPRRAGDAPPGKTGAGSFLEEIVVAGWFHDPGQDNTESNTWDLNAELIFRSVRFFDVENRFLDAFLSPRWVLGGSVNNENETHTVYAGANWNHRFPSDFFLGFTFGPVFHTGNTERTFFPCEVNNSCAQPGNVGRIDSGEVTLGSSVLFWLALEGGYWFGHHGVGLFAAHMSNGGLDDDNDGMNFLGLRYHYAFE